MKLLFCCSGPLTKELGTPKGLLEISEHLRTMGWQCDVRGRQDILGHGAESELGDRETRELAFTQALRAYIQTHGADYDVVEYDHKSLPFARSEFSGSTLMVARSFLLVHDQQKYPVPKARGPKALLRRAVKGRAETAFSRRVLQRATTTVGQADLINVNNTYSRDELVGRGIDAAKIVVFGRAIGSARRAQFDALSVEPPLKPVVAFVGSYDYRKGAYDFPVLVRSVLAATPGVRFKLLGTAGLFSTEAQVRQFFPRDLQDRIEVVPRFKAETLPELLADCSMGVFPSYWEGFGFGVLEMLAASLPVVAYDVPGPPMMLPAPYLVPAGDVSALSRRLIELLNDRDKLRAARAWARERSRDFQWTEIAQGTSEAYKNRLRLLRGE